LKPEHRAKTLFSVEEKISISIIAIFHVIGFVLLTFTKGGLYFLALDLVPLNIIFTVLVMMKQQKSWNMGLIIFGFTILLLGYVVEVIGVNTGLIFGQYTYGEILGIKFFGTPPLIGLNWFLLVYCAGCTVEILKSRLIVKVLISTCMLVFFDFLMEPVAVKLNFWTWNGGTIPTQNYIGWFATAFLFSFIFQITNWPKQNRLAAVVFAIQLIFFLLQNIF